MSNDIFQQWQDGIVTDIEALRAIWRDLRELEQDIAPLQAEREHLREQMGQIIARTVTVSIAGLGRALITNPSTVISYDSKALRELTDELEKTYPEIAERLHAAERVSMRSGSLRIEKA